MADFPVAVPSNVVQLTTAAIPGTPGGASLVANRMLRVPPGGVVLFPHTLTNGAVADTFALSVTNLPGLFDLGSIVILPDADGDGIPDSAVPVPPTVALAPGGVFRFVVSAIVPPGTAQFSTDQLQVNAQSTAFAGSTLANIDTAEVFTDPPQPPPDVVDVVKSFSVLEGPSPYTSVIVTLRYTNTRLGRSDFRLLDAIPAGFEYVPGSGRWSGAPRPRSRTRRAAMRRASPTISA